MSIAGRTQESTKVGARLRVIGAGQHDERNEFERDVRAGLTNSPKHLPCRHIYDAEGSKLFEQICELPEYYLTQAEREILETQADAIAESLDETDALIELGSGNSAKTRTLIGAILARRKRLHYVPIDISREILVQTASSLLKAFPGLEITAIAAEYVTALEHVRTHITGSKCIAWLGSSIGNYARADAAALTRQFADALDDGDKLLIGIDLRKDAATLERAYDDDARITAEFNTNILRRINRDLAGDFELDHFAYRAKYDEEEGAVIMGQVSKQAQTITVDALDLSVPLEPDEFILTERSYKYSPAEIDALAKSCGLTVQKQWTDAGKRFTLNMMSAGC